MCSGSAVRISPGPSKSMHCGKRCWQFEQLLQ
jgi:hypothetical protein